MSGSTVEKLLTDDEYQAIVEENRKETEEDEAKATLWDEENKKKKGKEKSDKFFRPYVHRWHDKDKYHQYSKEDVYYDDITKYIQSKMTEHNRLVLVLQGLLDRSPVMHPHPPWSLWHPESFMQALVLHYDDSRALTTGDKPDFDAYRRQLNASLKPGSITIGQEESWEVEEAAKEDARCSARGRGHGYSGRRFHPYGNPGPGKIAFVVGAKNKKITYQWTRERQIRVDDASASSEIGCKFTTDSENVFNISAYKPGDFKKFFSDPRTRAEYLQWAHLLLEAEEYHAGNRKVAKVKPLPPKRKTETGSIDYQRRKRNKALVGKAVRLIRDITTRSGLVHKKGSLWRITSTERGMFSLTGINEDGTFEKVRRGLIETPHYYFEVDPSVPAEKKEGKSGGKRDHQIGSK